MKTFNHFKSLVVMKKNLLFTMSAVLLMAGMVTTACSSDDDDVITTKTPESSDTSEPYSRDDGKIIPVSGDKSNFDDLYDFFNKELPLTSWGENNSAFLLDNSETCYFINSYDDLKAIYTGKEQMPSIDFESYTLIIGQKLSNNVYQNLDKQSFYERDGVTYLDLFFSGDIVLPMLAYHNYWGLYPKMSKRDINVNIIEIAF